MSLISSKSKTVSDVLAVFNKAIQELNVISAHRLADVEKQNELIERAREDRAAAQAEAEKALAVKAKLEKLIAQ